MSATATAELDPQVKDLEQVLLRAEARASHRFRVRMVVVTVLACLAIVGWVGKRAYDRKQQRIFEESLKQLQYEDRMAILNQEIKDIRAGRR